MIRIHRRLISVVISILIVCIAIIAIALVVKYDEQLKTEMALTESITMERQIVLKDKEFSTVCLNENYVYAGGTQGLFRINAVTMDIEELFYENQSFEVVRAIQVGSEGILWVGHGNGVTGLMDTGVVEHYGIDDGLPDHRVNDLTIRFNKIYVATFGGVGIINRVVEGASVSSEVITITEKDGLIKDITKVILVDSKDNLWAGSYTSTGGGVTKFDSKDMTDITYFTTENGLSHNAITAIAEDKNSGIWVGNGSYTEGGATRYIEKEGNWTVDKVLTMEQGLIGEKVRYIYMNEQSNIWFCSENDGIAVLNQNGTIHYLTHETGLSDNEVKKIVMDKAGNMWLASRRGVTVIDSQWLDNYLMRN